MSIHYGPIIDLWGGGEVLYTRPADNPVDPDAKAEVNEPLDRDRLAIGTAGYPHYCSDAPPPCLDTYLDMRDHPTIAFAFFLVVGPILAGTRSLVIRDADGSDAPARKLTPTGNGAQVLDSPEDKLKAAAEKIFEPHWPDILTGAECLNFGSWTQEVTWDRVNGLVAPVRFNSFRPKEIVLIPDDFNDFAGFKLGSEERDARYAFHCICDEHRRPLVGLPRTRTALASWWRSIKGHENADKLERKASGIQMQIGIPTGLQMNDADGSAMSNTQVAQRIKDAATSGKTWTVPRFAFNLETLKQHPELAKVAGVEVIPFDWGQTGPALLASIERQRRFDVEIVRAYHRPEREAMEGENGTKAEAGVHGQIGITDSELVHADLLTQFNEQPFDRFLVTNRGPAARGSMYWKANPLQDPQRLLYEKALLQMLADPIHGGAYEAHIDRRGFMQKSEMPLKPAEEVVEPPPLPTSDPNAEPGANGAGGRIGKLAESNGNGDGN